MPHDNDDHRGQHDRLTVDLNINFTGLPWGGQAIDFARYFADFGHKLDWICKSQEIIMATQEQATAAVAALKTATDKAAANTTALGVRVKGLEDAIKNAGLNSEQEALLLAELAGMTENITATAASLEGMGKSAEIPVPVPVPEPLPPV